MQRAADSPLYEIKADLFRGLAHPVRIRVLEILSVSPDLTCSVSNLLEDTQLEASHLSQHLAVLKRHRVVTSRREGSTVVYSLSTPGIAKLLAAAREFLSETLEVSKSQLGEIENLPPIVGSLEEVDRAN